MDTQRLSAVMLIAGFAVMALGFAFGLPGIYQTEDLAERVRIIEEKRTRWITGQSLTALGVLLMAAGFAVLAFRLRAEVNALVPGLGAAAMVVAAISAALFVYRQTTDPLSTYQGAYSGMQTLYYWLTVAGLVLFGVAFLRAGLPAWLGYLTAGAALVFGVLVFVTGSSFLTPGLVTLLSLLIAIILLRQKPLP